MGEALKREGRSPAERSPIAQSANDIFELAIKLCLLFFLVYWSVVLLRPFLSIALWSLILAVTLYPAFSWTAQLLGGRRKLAALIVTAISLLVFTGPIIWLGLSMIEGVASFSHRPRHRRHLNPPSLRGDQVLAIYWRPRLLFLGPGRYEHKTGH